MSTQGKQQIIAIHNNNGSEIIKYPITTTTKEA